MVAPVIVEIGDERFSELVAAAFRAAWIARLKGSTDDPRSERGTSVLVA
jgi:hypothetical protein